MQFRDLFRYANEADEPWIKVHEMARRIRATHPGRIGEIVFWSCELDPNVSLGHIVYELDRSSAYDDEYQVASIRFYSGLNRCWRRYVCAKELMHLFDDNEASTNSKDKFLKLLNELENPAPSGSSTAMYRAEFNAEWMALLVLCPPRLRDDLRSKLEAGEITKYEAALSLRIPEDTISSIMSETYDLAMRVFITAEEERVGV